MRVRSYYFKKALIFFISIYFTSCSFECDPTHCPELSDIGKNWIASIESIGDTITYCTSSGSCISFYKVSKTFTPSKVQSCEKEWFKCYCDDNCYAYGDLEYRTDTVDHALWYRYSEQSGQIGPKKQITTFMYDFMGIYREDWETQPGDTFFQAINFNNHTYNKVYSLHKDTIAFPDFDLWKTYYSESDGIIAFYKKGGVELYVRQ